MKLQLKYTTILSLMMIGILLIGTPNALAQDDHNDDMGHDSAEDMCDDPSQEETIIADPDDDGSNTYDQTTITTEPGTCLKIEFQNMAAGEEHSFAISTEDSGWDHNVHLHLMNASADHKSINLQMPDEETTIPFFCNVSDHKEDGMVGQIVVESPSFLPGFGLTSALFALTAMIIAVPILRKK